MRRLIPTACLLLCGISWAADHALWTRYKSDPDRQENIPNVSYAGYHNGEKPLPNPASPVVNVKSPPYNAKGDGVTDDTQAIRDAIAAIGSAGGVVYFPDGTYLVSGVVFVHQNGTILRGQSRDKAKIRFTKSLNEAYGIAPFSNDRSLWSWSGGLLWFSPESNITYRPDTSPVIGLKESWNIGPELSAISSIASRGDKTLTVSNPAGLKAGQFVFVRVGNPADLSLLKHLCGGGPWADAFDWSEGNSGNILSPAKPFFDWVVQIESIAGNTVTLKQPLRFDLRSAWNPKIMAMGNVIQECGLENMTLEFARDYEYNDGFHNKEPGWNGPLFNIAINCFVRGVTLIDSDVGFAVTAGKNITFTDIKVGFSVASRRKQHHGLMSRIWSQDCLWENFEIASEPRHGLTTEDFSMGQVWSKGVMKYGTFDTHKRMPSECVRTQITINNNGLAGGTGGPRMGARWVNWNVEVTNNRNYLVGEPGLMPKGALIGVRGCAIAAAGNSQAIFDLSGLTGSVPEPANLFEAQKKLRLSGPGVFLKATRAGTAARYRPISWDGAGRFLFSRRSDGGEAEGSGIFDMQGKRVSWILKK